MSDEQAKTRLLSLAEVAVSEEELSNIPFEVLKVGEYYDSRYGKFKVTSELLANLKKNFDDKVLEIDVALDVNHNADAGAYAWISELEVKNNSLFAKFRDFTEEALKMFKQKMFKYFSVEFSPFTKVVDGKQMTIKDVLRGIALTNRPVIKGMQPTFLAEAEQINKKINSYNMSNAIKVLSEHLLTRGKVSKADVDSLKVAFAALSEDEQAEAAEAVAKVEAEAVKTEEAEAANAADNQANAGDDNATPDAAAASEAVKLSEQEAKELSELREEKRQRIYAERVNGLMLSEANLTGFTKDKATNLSEFVQSLDEAQYSKFTELVKAVKTVDKIRLSEIGSGQSGEPEGSDSEEAKLKRVEVLAKQLLAEDDTLEEADAVAKAQKQVFNQNV